MKNFDEIKNLLKENKINFYENEDGNGWVDLDQKKKFLNLISKAMKLDWQIENYNHIAYFTDAKYASHERFDDDYSCSTHFMVKEVANIELKEFQGEVYMDIETDWRNYQYRTYQIQLTHNEYDMDNVKTGEKNGN